MAYIGMTLQERQGRVEAVEAQVISVAMSATTTPAEQQEVRTSAYVRAQTLTGQP